MIKTIPYKLNNYLFSKLVPEIKAHNNVYVLEKLNDFKFDSCKMMEDKRIVFNAILSKNYEVVEFVLNNFRQHNFLEEYIAMSLNDEKMLNIILNSDQEDNEMLTILLLFSALKMESVEHLLLAQKRGVNLNNLYFVSESDFPAEVLKKKSQLVFKDCSVLSFAIQCNSEKMVKELIKLGVKPTEDDILFTLNLKEKYQLNMLKLLHENNENLKFSQAMFCELLEYSNKDEEALIFLLNHKNNKYDKQEVFKTAVKCGADKLIIELLNENINLDFSTSKLLMYAVSNKDKKTAKALINRGAYIDDDVLYVCSKDFEKWLLAQKRFEDLEYKLNQNLDIKKPIKKIKV